MGAELTRETEKSFDWLFSALDGKFADGAPARILGIYDDGSEWWIQVARGDDDIDTIVLRLSRFASVFNAVGGAEALELVGNERAANRPRDVSGLNPTTPEAQASAIDPSARAVLTRFFLPSSRDRARGGALDEISCRHAGRRDGNTDTRRDTQPHQVWFVALVRFNALPDVVPRSRRHSRRYHPASSPRTPLRRIVCTRRRCGQIVGESGEMSRITMSPATWPNRSLMLLKPSRSTINRPTEVSWRIALMQFFLQSRLEVLPVEESAHGIDRPLPGAYTCASRSTRSRPSASATGAISTLIAAASSCE